jgi:hypothetical protein
MRIMFLLWLLVSCSGYRFTQQDNPLSQYGIQSLSVPMFYNYSDLPELSADFTRETYRLLMNYNGLRLHNGYDKDSDAVLIGIIKSPDKVMETVKPIGSPVVAQDKVKQLRQNPDKPQRNRQKFYTPSANQITLSLHIIVIKKPTEEELALLKSGIGGEMKLNSRVIFNEILPLITTYNREFLAAEGLDVVGTQNAGVQRKVLKTLAEQAAISVRDMVLYAF